MGSCSSSRRADSNSVAEHRDRVPCGDALPGLTSAAVKSKRLRREKPAMGHGAGPHLLPLGLGPNVGPAASPAGARRPRAPAAAPASPPRPGLRRRAARCGPPRGHREAAGARPGLAPPGWALPPGPGRRPPQGPAWEGAAGGGGGPAGLGRRQGAPGRPWVTAAERLSNSARKRATGYLGLLWQSRNTL